MNYEDNFLDFDGVITTLESGWNLCPKKCNSLVKLSKNRCSYRYFIIMEKEYVRRYHKIC